MPDLAALLAERNACAWYRRRVGEHRAARPANRPPRKDPQ